MLSYVYVFLLSIDQQFVWKALLGALVRRCGIGSFVTLARFFYFVFTHMCAHWSFEVLSMCTLAISIVFDVVL